jgi:CubicO group peptidase (beta-lactamase class C family)
MDTVFWLASFTKFITAIAIMQCVEKGLLNLEAPVGNILPEYLEPKILRGYTAEDKPILEKSQHTLTLRSRRSSPFFDLLADSMI